MYDPDLGGLAARILSIAGWALIILGALGAASVIADYDEYPIYLAGSFSCIISGLLIWAASEALKALISLTVTSKKRLELEETRIAREVGLTVETKDGHDITIDRDGGLRIDAKKFRNAAGAKEWIRKQNA
jgi:hypothetical protein